MDLVTIEETDEMNAAAVNAPNSTPSIVRVVADGEANEKRVDYAPGHAENPLSKAELEAKVTSMAEPLLTNEQIDAVVQFCDHLTEQPRVDPLIDAITV